MQWDKSLLVAAVVCAVIGPRWVMNVFQVSWEFAALTTLVAAAGILVGVIVHEVGHAVAARVCGVRVGGIRVAWWGGATSLGPSPFSASAVIAVSGPVINGLFAFLLYGLSQVFDQGWWGMGLYLAAWINGFLTVFNLLPFAPLDGAHFVSDVVALITSSREKGEQLVAWLGLSAIPLALAFFVLRGRWSSWTDLLILVLLLGMVWNFSFKKLKQVDASRKSAGVVRMMKAPVRFAEAGTPFRSVEVGQDVVVLSKGEPVGYVPGQLLSTAHFSDPSLVIEQLSSPLASDRISADVTPLELGEYVQGHYLVRAKRELGQDYEPVWLVEDQGKIIGLVQHQKHLAYLAG